VQNSRTVRRVFFRVEQYRNLVTLGILKKCPAIADSVLIFDQRDFTGMRMREINSAKDNECFDVLLVCYTPSEI
jgi:hypothetical protein